MTTTFTGIGDSDLTVTDFNSDGFADILHCNQLYLGRGNGTFESVRAVGTFGDFQNEVAPAVADLNGDGILDLIKVNNESASLSVLLQNTVGTLDRPDTSELSISTASLATGV